jgi:hypothetical protein
MRKIITLSAILLGFISTANAQETTQEMKARLQAGIIESPNGDKIIELPILTDGLKEKLDFAYMVLWVPLILQLEKNPNWDMLNKSMPNDRDYLGFTTVSTYLKKRTRANCKISKKFSANYANKSLEAGIPIAIRPFESKAEERKPLIDRAKDRSSIATPEDLKKFAASNEIRKLLSLKTYTHPTIIIGYNKHTKEFCIKEYYGQPMLWLTEKEMQQLVGEVFEIKIQGVN